MFGLILNVNCLNASNPSPGGAARTIANALFFTRPANSPYSFADLCLTSLGALLMSKGFEGSSVI
jgi:hypothetical protein